MKFFFADCQDTVDPTFDFVDETRSEWRVRQRDDVYAHELHQVPIYDGILLSKAHIEPNGQNGSRFSLAQRHRLFRLGARNFFRLGDRPVETMGDCGAFSYVREKYPPVSVEEVIDFYQRCDFDYGISVDHVILGYRSELDNHLPNIDPVPEEWRERREITLELAIEFHRVTNGNGIRFAPIGTAQGWSPRSYAEAVEALQKIGFRYIALGGMVPLKTPQILQCLEAIDCIRRSDTQLHLLGIARWDQIAKFRRLGVASFDSTSPLRQAFMDDRDNYYTKRKNYLAIRVPQVEGNPQLLRRIRSGELNQELVRNLEKDALEALRQYDQDNLTIESVLETILDYERVHHPRLNQLIAYRDVLGDRPWRNCPCAVCRKIGIDVILFRGTERNKRRGFHNLYVVYQRLQDELAVEKVSQPT